MPKNRKFIHNIGPISSKDTPYEVTLSSRHFACPLNSWDLIKFVIFPTNPGISDVKDFLPPLSDGFNSLWGALVTSE